jgi:hypothetical protein
MDPWGDRRREAGPLDGRGTSPAIALLRLRKRVPPESIRLAIEHARPTRHSERAPSRAVSGREGILRPRIADTLGRALRCGLHARGNTGTRSASRGPKPARACRTPESAFFLKGGHVTTTFFMTTAAAIICTGSLLAGQAQQSDTSTMNFVGCLYRQADIPGRSPLPLWRG